MDQRLNGKRTVDPSESSVDAGVSALLQRLWFSADYEVFEWAVSRETTPSLRGVPRL